MFNRQNNILQNDLNNVNFGLHGFAMYFRAARISSLNIRAPVSFRLKLQTNKPQKVFFKHWLQKSRDINSSHSTTN